MLIPYRTLFGLGEYFELISQVSALGNALLHGGERHGIK